MRCPSTSFGGVRTPTGVPTREGAARQGASRTPGTAWPSTVNDSMVAVPCMASTRADGPPKLILSTRQPCRHAGSRAVAVERPSRYGPTSTSRAAPWSSRIASDSPSRRKSPRTRLSTAIVSREPFRTTGGPCGPSSRATCAADCPGVHWDGQDATRASRDVSTTTRGIRVTPASSTFGVLTPAAISQRPCGSISWVSPTARDSESLVGNDRGAPTCVAAALARQVEAASDTPTVKTATVSAAVTGRITSVPSRRRRTVRDATYDESDRRLDDQRSHRSATARTSSPHSSPIATARSIGRARSVASGACGWLRLAATTRAATAAATSTSRTITRARPARVGRRTPAIWTLSGSLTASRTTRAATSAVTSTTATTARPLASTNGTGSPGTNHCRASARAAR